jgi:hypothetical protein
MEADLPEVTARVYAEPIVDTDNCVPMVKRWEVLSKSLDVRVTSVKNDKVPPKRYVNFAQEFVGMLVPQGGGGCPYSLEETSEMLSKPSQVLAVKQIWETVDMEPRRLIEAFVKNEPCMKNPRIISSFADMRYLLQLSKYTLKFRDEVLHHEDNQHWFMPGGTPEQLAEKVVEYVRAVESPNEGDFSNLDGTVSAWIQRHVVNASYLRYFRKEFREELGRYLEMLITCPSRAKRFGFRYDSGPGIKSGSPTTCDGNSEITAFVMFCAIRIAMPELSVHEAWRLLGLCFGDDSLFEERFRKTFQKAADDLGLSLKVERFNPEQGVTFLARVFPDPFTTKTSFQDPLRTWRKLHITFRDPNVPLADAAVDRLEGYLVTDPFAPITSAFARSVIRYYNDDCPEKASAFEKRQERRSADREKPYWLTVGGSWPQAQEDFDLMLKCAAARTGFELENLRALHYELEESHDPWKPRTLRSDAGVSPYKDTLDEDAQPAEGLVDLRKFQNDRQTNNLREGGELSQASAGDRREADRGARRGGVHGRDRAPGPRRAQRVCAPNGPEGAASNRLAPVQAHREGVLARGGEGSRRRSALVAPHGSRGQPGRGRRRGLTHRSQ